MWRYFNMYTVYAACTCICKQANISNVFWHSFAFFSRKQAALHDLVRWMFVARYICIFLNPLKYMKINPHMGAQTTWQIYCIKDLKSLGKNNKGSTLAFKLFKSCVGSHTSVFSTLWSRQQPHGNSQPTFPPKKVCTFLTSHHSNETQCKNKLINFELPHTAITYD